MLMLTAPTLRYRASHVGGDVWQVCTVDSAGAPHIIVPESEGSHDRAVGIERHLAECRACASVAFSRGLAAGCGALGGGR